MVLEEFGKKWAKKNLRKDWQEDETIIETRVLRVLEKLEVRRRHIIFFKTIKESWKKLWEKECQEEFRKNFKSPGKIGRVLRVLEII